jgi:transposase
MSQGLTIPPELDAEMTPGVRAFVRLLLGRIEQLEAEVADLKKRLEKYDGTSHSDPPAGAASSAAGSSPSPVRKTTSRKRGGQPGHRRHFRQLIPTEECDQVYQLKPEHCRRCGTALSGFDPEPLRHQVSELPEIRLHVTEYQLHRLTCPCCSRQTCAELPAGVPSGQSGPRLVAFTSLLMGMFRQSKRRVSLFCETLLNHPVSVGLVVKHQQQTSNAVAAACEELVQLIPQQHAVCADETPTRQQNQNAWIWTVVATTFTVFRIRLTKAAWVIKELLGDDFKGVATSDRAKTYHWLWRHQWCWAHLKRDFEKISQRLGPAGEIGQKLLDCTHRLFHDWHRIRDQEITRRGFECQMTRLKREVEQILTEGSRCADRATAATCSELLNHFDNLWLFIYCKDVEPTNNAAERSLRHAVIWKHLSFGTQSEHGSRFVERLLTVIETCRQQKRNAFDFLVDSLIAQNASTKPPQLLAGA